MPAPSASSTNSLRSSIRILTGILVIVPFVITVAVAFLLPDPLGTTPTSAYLIVAGIVALALLAVLTIGFRVRSIPAGEKRAAAQALAQQEFQRSTMTRFAIADAAVIASLVIAFMVPRGGLPLLLIGALASTLMIIVFVWPSDRVVARVQRNLDHAGGRSSLAEALQQPMARPTS